MSNQIQNPAIANLVNQIAPNNVVRSNSNLGNANSVEGSDFNSILQDRLKVSGHASTRLQSRNIQLGQAEWNRVLQGVDKAAAKGSKESLVLCDNVALLVSVKNRTVITAVDQANLKDNVFTNIDSAVIV